MTLLADRDVTEEWKGAEEIIQKSIVIMYKIRSHYDLCTDSSGPKTILFPGQIREAYFDLKRRGVKIRMITEITNDNLAETKESMKMAEVRHLEAILGNFVIADSTDYAGAPETKDGLLMKLMVSNVGAFVKQQQYFFETLWEKAIPAEQRIKQVEEGSLPVFTETVYGAEKVIQVTLHLLSKIKSSLDMCGDSKGPGFILAATPVHQRFVELKSKGVRIRMIVEITNDNINESKKMLEFAELRHLDGLMGYSTIMDTRVFASNTAGKGTLIPHVVYSTVPALVQQQQYFFEMLWNKAIPADQKLKEIEEGIVPEITEVVTGWDSIFKRNIENLSTAKQRVDTCFDSEVPRIIVESPMYKASYEFVNRGGKIRGITEITEENLPSIKELMKIQEIRHIDNFKINFGMSEKVFSAPTSVYSASSNPQCIYSNSKDLIREHQYLFETLWEKAIPASEKIRQIEEGIEPQKIELIQDTRKSISLAFEVMKRTKEELLILFATPRTFILGYSLGSIDNYDQMSKRGVNVRLLVPKGSEIENEVAKIKELYPSINVRISEADLNTNITILVSDRKEFISWELKDDTLSDPYEAGGIATHSNIRSLATSYGTIFDNLWKITEFTENLKAANVKLEKSEKSMKDFIDVAAHELRTPIQPIIGLTEVLRDKTNDPAQAVLFDAIIRNAERLQRLQEDILDVTKIESQLIRFDKQTFYIDEVIAQALEDIKRSPTDSGNVKVLADLQATSTVRGDRQRIVQVILNLVANSMKFTKNGTIIVRSRRLDEKVAVSIIDTGTGIDPEIMPRLFTKFATKSPSGTGLGLFISKSIIEAHGGKIWAENNSDGLGATFSFSLPKVNN